MQQSKTQRIVRLEAISCGTPLWRKTGSLKWAKSATSNVTIWNISWEPTPIATHGRGLAVLHPVYYSHIYRNGLSKFIRFAENVWGISRDGKSDETLAKAGIEALADFIKEIGLPTTLRELGMTDRHQLKEIADSCGISAGSYKKMTHKEILEIFNECFE